jgi:hypothetical protein
MLTSHLEPFDLKISKVYGIVKTTASQTLYGPEKLCLGVRMPALILNLLDFVVLLHGFGVTLGMHRGYLR